MKQISTRVFTAVILYIIIMFSIHYIQPSFAFKENGELRTFGVNKDNGETVYSFGVITVVVAVLTFYPMCVNDMIN